MIGGKNGGFILCCVCFLFAWCIPVYADEYVLDEIYLENDYQEDYQSDFVEWDDASPSDATPSNGGWNYGPFASYPNVDDGSISTSILQYFKDIAVKLPYGSKYVMFRENEYVYRMVYGKELEVSGNRFTGTDLNFVRYYRTSGNSSYFFSSGREGDFSLNTNGRLVYSNVGTMYPVLIGGVYTYEILAVLFVLAVTLLYGVCKSFFGVGRQRI